MATIGGSLNVSWVSADWFDPDGNPLPVKIELTRDGGGSWTTIVASTPDTGSYIWIVTGPASATCQFRFSDPADATVNFLGTTFSIVASSAATLASSKLEIAMGMGF